MNNKEFISELAARLKYNTKETSVLLNALLQEFTLQLEEDNTVSLSGLGTFEVRKKLERVVVNPSTKQRMLIPPKMVIKFTPISSLKDKVNKK
jgi:DNA-binding protein HU-beta